MDAYLNLVKEVLDKGDWQENRTGVRTKSIPGAMLRFDLQKGFPAVTTKKLAFKSAIGELVGFLRGSRDAAEFRRLGCKVWDQNANENQAWLQNPYRLGTDDLGAVYGVQWRAWPAYKQIVLNQANTELKIAHARKLGFVQVGECENEAGQACVLLYKAVDQLMHCVKSLIENPSDRRILFHGWNWAQLDEMALPPCHLLYHFLVNVERKELSMCLYLRSNDLGLGTPFNLTEGAALMHLVARLTGLTPRWFTYFIGDAHVYENHVPMLEEQLTRTPFDAPKLILSDRIPDYAVTQVFEPEWLMKVEPSDFSLEGYQHHPALSAPMAV